MSEQRTEVGIPAPEDESAFMRTLRHGQLRGR